MRSWGYFFKLEHFLKIASRFSDKKCDENKKLEPFVKSSSETKNALIMGLVGLGLVSCTVTDLNKASLAPSAQPLTVDVVGHDSRIARLGAAQHPRILGLYGGEYSDPKLERMVAKIVGKLANSVGHQSEPYRITILNSPSINAFALPGGYVYVTRGLLGLANDSSEVAAVIAHEMAHITANHSLLRQEKQAEMEVTSNVVGEVLGDKLGEQEIKLRSRLSLAQFSRNQELQADEIGIKTVAASGYDPFAASRFLLRMEAYSGFRSISGATNSQLDFLATHPATPQRVKLATTAARQISAPGVGATDRDALLDGLDGVLYGDREEEGYIRGLNFIHPRLGIAFRVPAGFALDNSKAAVIANGPENVAIRFDSVARPKETPTPLDYIRSGWVSGLEAGTIRTFKQSGFAAASARAQSDKWHFAIIVIMIKDRIYRFLTAAPKNIVEKDETLLTRLSTSVADSFKLLSKAEIANLKPLRLKIVRVGQGETVASLAARMRNIEGSEALFRLLNGLSDTARLREGMRVKIISE